MAGGRDRDDAPVCACPVKEPLSPPAGTMKIAVARKRKKIEPPKPDVAEKIDAGFTHGEFDRALKVTKRQLDDSSGRDPKSPRTSA